MLEFGEGYGSLREGLRTSANWGRTPETTSSMSIPPATTLLGTEPPGTTPPGTRSLAKEWPTEKSPAKGAAPKPAPKHEEEPSFRVVTLAAGETLYGLCRAQLGDGQRWKEVAALNGWSLARAAKLTAGQAVKLPVR